MKAKLLAVTALLCGFGAFVRSEDEKPTMNIVETAVAAKKFDTLVAAVKAAGLAETLSGKGPFTVFAPTDEAFKKLGDDKIKAVLADKELLTKILMAHVVKEKSVMAADVVKMDGKKVNGFEIKVEGKDVMLGSAKVIKTDIKCTNGVIHVIDTVLIPDSK